MFTENELSEILRSIQDRRVKLIDVRFKIMERVRSTNTDATDSVDQVIDALDNIVKKIEGGKNG